MSHVTIQTEPQRQERLGGLRAPAGLVQQPKGLPATWLVAALILLTESGLAAVGARIPALSTAALIVAPGLALAGLLPEPTRQSWSATLAALPVLGFAASSVALITLASLGISLDGVTTRLALAVLVAAGLFVSAPTPRIPVRGGEALGAAGLVGAVVLAAILSWRIIGGSPVPGNDWAKYVLYADQIREHGSLLIDNPFWMLGVPFREDPAVPAVYGGFLALAREPASTVAHGIGLFALLQVGAMFALVRSFWGPAAGALAAALLAALPLNGTILGWHGLANLAALALLPLVLLYAASLLAGRLDGRGAAGAGLALVALAAAHRLSFMVILAAIVLMALVAIGLAGRRQLAGGALRTLGFAALFSPGVIYDLVERNRTFGGTLGYKAYLPSKIHLDLLLHDITWPFSVVAAVAVLAGLVWARRERPLVPLLSLLAVVTLLSVSWLVHLPLHYTRMAYYLPLPLAALVAVAIVRWSRPRRAAPVAAAVLVAYLAVVSFASGDDVRAFYRFANPASLKGLDAVSAQLRPHEVVVTDRCWSFLSTWLLHTRTLPALDQADIQPKAELPRARQARSVLEGTASGRALARRLGVRFILVDPTCSDARGRPVKPPRLGRPVFASRRLVILRLGSR